MSESEGEDAMVETVGAPRNSAQEAPKEWMKLDIKL